MQTLSQPIFSFQKKFNGQNSPALPQSGRITESGCRNAARYKKRILTVAAAPSD
jgi:hypothetical protein